MTEVAVHPECPFSSETFDLLQQFKNNSKRDFYLAHEEKFKKYVEQPLQKLSRHVSAQLSGEITKQLEIDTDVLPNTTHQYSQYTYQKKLGSNIGDANLFINLTPEEFRFGLFISKTSSDKQRFIKNLQNNQIKEIILQNTHLPDKCVLHYSSNRRLDRFNRLSEWLKLVARQNSATKNIQISVHLKPNEVLLSSSEDLITQIKQTLEAIFPIFLLATHDEPSFFLKQYLNQSNIKFSKRYYTQGLKNYQEGNYQDAIKKFDDALEKASNLPEAYSYRGKAKAEMGDTEGAISDYSQLLLIQPKNAEAYQHRGNLYFKLKDYDAAIKDYNQALNIHPSFALTYYYRGCVHVELGNAQKAIEDLGKAAKLFDKEKDADNYEETQRILKTIQPDYPEPSFIEMYTLCQCAEETGLEKTELESWIRAINRKGQAILYGSPGTGKTFIAEKLAQHLIGGGNGFSELVQFHPAYSYKDFIQGIRPQSEDGKLTYPLLPGRFVDSEF